MSESPEMAKDPVLEALSNLTRVAASCEGDLAELRRTLTRLRQNRLDGWSLRRMMAEAGSPSPLSLMTKVASNLARACGGFRRALALGLRQEGLQVTEIATLFEVSRQRVSALVRLNGLNHGRKPEETASETV
jgi:hypothetical protein